MNVEEINKNDIKTISSKVGLINLIAYLFIFIPCRLMLELCYILTGNRYSSILGIRTSTYISDREYRYTDNIEENNKYIYIEENKQVLKDKGNFIDGYYQDLSLLSGSLGIALVLFSVISEYIDIVSYY